jgi:hypothetical protein
MFMKKEMHMKNLIAIAVLVVVGITGFMFMKNRFGMNINAKISAPGQIMLLNDSSDTISVEYKLGGQDIATTLPSREKITCGNDGFVRIFTANKNGSYELMYPAEGELREVTLSQIVGSVKKESDDNELYTKKGMLGDIKVTYEEPLELDATY